VRLVVDASVAVKWFIAEPGHEFAAALLEAFPERIASGFVVVELANVLWKKLGRAEICAFQAEEALRELPRFFQSFLPARDLVSRAPQLSLDLNHPVYDCLYLACAEQESAKLATADARLAKKCANTSFAARFVFLDGFIDPATLI